MTTFERRRISRFPHVLHISVLLFVFAFAVTGVLGQSATPTPTIVDETKKPIAIRTDLVTLTLTVTDLYGRYVSGLSKNAFTVTDNNEEQNITFFSDSDAPVSVGVLFDVSGSMGGDKIMKARNALSKFI